MAEFLVFRLDAVNIGLRASTVERVAPAVEITPLPGAPAITMGVIRVRGVTIPVVDLRERLGLPARPLALADRLVIARTPLRTLAVVADAVEGLHELADSEISDASKLVPGVRQVSGIAGREDGIIFIHDLESFLSASEGAALDEALAANPSVPGDPHAP